MEQHTVLEVQVFDILNISKASVLKWFVMFYPPTGCLCVYLTHISDLHRQTSQTKKMRKKTRIWLSCDECRWNAGARFASPRMVCTCLPNFRNPACGANTSHVAKHHFLRKDGITVPCRNSVLLISWSTIELRDRQVYGIPGIALLMILSSAWQSGNAISLPHNCPCWKVSMLLEHLWLQIVFLSWSLHCNTCVNVIE